MIKVQCTTQQKNCQQLEARIARTTFGSVGMMIEGEGQGWWAWWGRPGEWRRKHDPPHKEGEKGMGGVVES